MWKFLLNFYIRRRKVKVTSPLNKVDYRLKFPPGSSKINQNPPHHCFTRRLSSEINAAWLNLVKSCDYISLKQGANKKSPWLRHVDVLLWTKHADSCFIFFENVNESGFLRPIKISLSAGPGIKLILLIQYLTVIINSGGWVWNIIRQGSVWLPSFCRWYDFW
jgi:hypothetical protein